MKKTRLITTILFSGMLLLSGCGSESSDAPAAPPAAETPPPAETPAPPADEPSATIVHETSVVTTSGERIPVKVTTEGFIFVGYEGKPVLFEFYGDTCPHCLNAIPMYNSLNAKYGSSVLILTIESYGQLNNAALQNFVSSKGIQYRTVAMENSGNVKTYAEELVGPMGGVPYLIVLDKSGGIVTKVLGDVEESWLEGVILDLL